MNGIQTHNLCLTGAMLCQLSYQSHMRVVVFVSFFHLIEKIGAVPENIHTNSPREGIGISLGLGVGEVCKTKKFKEMYEAYQNFQRERYRYFIELHIVDWMMVKNTLCTSCSCSVPFSSPEAVLLLVSIVLWAGPTPEVCDSQTSCQV